MQIHIIKQDICISIYMLPIAGQTGGPIRLKKWDFKKNFHGQRRAFQLVIYITKQDIRICHQQPAKPLDRMGCQFQKLKKKFHVQRRAIKLVIINNQVILKKFNVNTNLRLKAHFQLNHINVRYIIFKQMYSLHEYWIIVINIL